MRILHVNKYLYRRGGAEGYMLDLAARQRHRGHDVEFFAMDHPENDPATYVEHFPPTVELDPPPDRLAARVKVAATMIWSTRAKRGMRRVVEHFRPDVVHLHNVYHQLSPSVLHILRTSSIPAVMTLHDYKLACPTYQFLDHGTICEACLGRRFHHAVQRRCNQGSLIASATVAAELGVHTLTGAYSPVDVFVCPSAFLRAKMLAGRVFPDRLHHLPHFADLHGIQPAEGVGRGVVVAGRLSSEKGVDVAIESMALLPGEQLVVAGDGPERSTLEQLAAARAPGRVEFTGRLTATALHDRIRGAAVVVVPSRWYENQPMIVLEAFACARPVIASDLGGLPELIRDGTDGRLVPHDDPQLLARAIAAILAVPDEAAQMGQRGRDRALRSFSVEAHLDGLETLYDLARARKGRDTAPASAGAHGCDGAAITIGR